MPGSSACRTTRKPWLSNSRRSASVSTGGPGSQSPARVVARESKVSTSPPRDFVPLPDASLVEMVASGNSRRDGGPQEAARVSAHGRTVAGDDGAVDHGCRNAGRIRDQPTPTRWLVGDEANAGGRHAIGIEEHEVGGETGRKP